MSGSLSILIICKSLPWRFNGGIQTHVWDLSRTLITKGHKVTVLTGGAWKNRPKSFLKEGVEIVEIPFFPGRRLPFFSSLIEEFAFNFSARNWVKVNHAKFDIIHAQGRSGYLLYSVRPIQKKLVQTIHGLTDKEANASNTLNIDAKSHSFFARKWESKLLEATRATIVVSSDLRSAISKSNESIRVIPNGVKKLHSGFNSKEIKSNKRFVFVGRLSPIKGLVPLIKAIGKSKADLFLDIIGDGPQRAEIQTLISKFNLQNNVRLLGQRSNEEVRRSLSYYQALVLPSFFETQGIVLLEANYQEIPVIASDLPAIRESVTHMTNGLLCDSYNPSSFVEAMIRLRDDNSLAQRMGQAGKTIVEQNFSWDRIGDETLKVYYKIAG